MHNVMYMLTIMISATILFGCNKSNEKVSVDERWHQYEKGHGENAENILASANKIIKNSKYTEEEIWVIIKAFSLYFIGIECEFKMPENKGNTWQTSISIGRGLGGSSRLSINDKTGMISYESREVGTWQDLSKFVNTYGFGHFKTSKDQEVSILDSFKSEKYKEIIFNAEQDLPDDIWIDSPRVGCYNDSRSNREFIVTSKFLNDIKPKVENMKAIDLIRSIKSRRGADHPGIGYFIYLNGNNMLIEAMRRRPKKELLELRPFYLSHVDIWTGGSGMSLGFSDVLDELLRENNSEKRKK